MSTGHQTHIGVSARSVRELAKILSSRGAEEPLGENSFSRQKEPGRANLRSEALLPLFICQLRSLMYD